MTTIKSWLNTLARKLYDATRSMDEYSIEAMNTLAADTVLYREKYRNAVLAAEQKAAAAQAKPVAKLVKPAKPVAKKRSSSRKNNS